MGENSAIAWTDHTFNPWWGCVKVSPGCEHCYAETWAKRTGHAVWGPAKTTPRRELSDANWKNPLKWDRDALERYGRRARVFCGSMCDVFEDHPQLPPLRARLWTLIEETPHLEWLLLTKRPENIWTMIPYRWAVLLPENVRFGTTAENQEMADRRIPELLKVPAPNFLSVEPLLGPVDLPPHWMDRDRYGANAFDGGATLHWVIVGGESGHGARRCDVEWIRSIATQCKASGVPVFVKQLGARPVDSVIRWVDPKRQALSTIHDPKGADPEEWPEDLRVQEFPGEEAYNGA